MDHAFIAWRFPVPSPFVCFSCVVLVSCCQYLFMDFIECMSECMSELPFNACLNSYSKVADSRVLWERRLLPRSDDRIWLCSTANLAVRTL
jgi:hypothetical protein